MSRTKQTDLLPLVAGQGQRRRLGARWPASSDVSALWRRSDGFTQQSISDLSSLPGGRGHPHSSAPSTTLLSSSVCLPLLKTPPLFASSEAISGPEELVFLPPLMGLFVCSSGLIVTKLSILLYPGEVEEQITTLNGANQHITQKQRN